MNRRMFLLRDSASPREPPLISHRHPESALDLDLFLDDDKRRCMLRFLTEVLTNKVKRITIDPEIAPLSESSQCYTTRRCTDVHLTTYPLPAFGYLY